MAHSIEITSTDDQISLLPRIEKDEIEEGKKVDHLIDTNGQDPSGSQAKSSVNQIFDEMFENLDNFSIKSWTIFKVNVWLRESNPDAYTPKMVSIGPYHKKNPQLHQMEKYKLVYLRRFLQRKEGLDVKSCLNELEELKEKAIKCYQDVEDLGSNSQFCQMLLLDGCFVVEFIREYSTMYANEAGKIINTNGSYVFRDLMLLENQLPFIVVNKLHLMTKSGNESPLAILGNEFFTHFVGLPIMTHASSPRTECNDGNIKHLLHLLHIFSCHGNPKKKSKDDKKKHTVMPNATELSQAGVCFLKEDTRGCYNVKYLLHLEHKLFCQRKQENNIDRFLRRAISEREQENNIDRFLRSAILGREQENNMDRKLRSAILGREQENNIDRYLPRAISEREPESEEVKSEGNRSLFDIKFENGSMTIPCFKVTDNTETILRNIIAYEQQSSDVQPKYFSDFSIFMDYLIDSDKDVNLLRQKEIIENLIGDDKEVANIFNKMGTGVTICDDFYYKEECREAAEHCKKPWNNMKANLLRNYFSSPWVGASTVAAILLLIFTFIQTILAFIDSVNK